MNYQEKLLELAKKEGIQGLKGEKFEDIYNKVFFKLLSENKQLNQAIEFKDKYFYELNDKYIEMKKGYKNLLEENENYKSANKSLGNFRVSLEEKVDKQKSYISELEYQSMEQAKTEESLREIIDNYRKGIKDSNIQLAEFKGIEEKLKGEIANLKQILKAVTYLL
jgi:DNA repair ATPase RecN